MRGQGEEDRGAVKEFAVIRGYQYLRLLLYCQVVQMSLKKQGPNRTRNKKNKMN